MLENLYFIPLTPGRALLVGADCGLREAFKAAYAIAGAIPENELNPENIIPKAFDLKVQKLVAEAVKEAADALQSDLFIPCTGCGYCFECPQEIQIPKIFSAYNEAAAKGFHYIWGSLSGIYKKLGPNGRDCIGCGNCESHCPQKIQIIDLLKKIDDKYIELEKAGE